MSGIEGAEFYISKKVGKAIMDYQMIADGDKIAVAVSGGKDSLTLLRVLNDRRRFVPIKYDLLAVHVDMGYPCQHPRLLAAYFEKMGVNYHIEKIDILKGKPLRDISCFWCAWNRRKAIFSVADRFGCTKVALGHHHDDVVETILLNLFFHAEISAMSARQELFSGKIVVIRPLVYVEEREIVRFSGSLGFPQHKCACPNSRTSRRVKVASVLSDLQKICPEVKKNVFRSLQRIKKDYLP